MTQSQNLGSLCDEKIDWNGPVEPGRSMLGLRLGLPLSVLRPILGEAGNIISDTPRMAVDYDGERLVLLRAVAMDNCHYDWQNIMARMMFEGGVLSCIVVHGNVGNEGFFYLGKLLGKVGLGSKVSDLLEFGDFEFDDAEEVFRSDQWPGFEIGGSNACDLKMGPDQVVTTFRVFVPR